MNHYEPTAAMPTAHPTALRAALEQSSTLFAEVVLRRSLAEGTYAALRRKLDRSSEDNLPHVIADFPIKDLDAGFQALGIPTPIHQPREMNSFLGSYIIAFEKAGSKIFDFSAGVSNLKHGVDAISTQAWGPLPTALFINFAGSLKLPESGVPIAGVYYQRTPKAYSFAAFQTGSLMTTDNKGRDIADLHAISRHAVWNVFHTGEVRRDGCEYNFISQNFEDFVHLTEMTHSALTLIAAADRSRSGLS